MKLLIIIPAYNESLNIGNTVSALLELFPEADYVVINDDLQQCVADICDLLKIEKYRYSRMKAFVDDIIENN